MLVSRPEVSFRCHLSGAVLFWEQVTDFHISKKAPMACGPQVSDLAVHLSVGDGTQVLTFTWHSESLARPQPSVSSSPSPQDIIPSTLCFLTTPPLWWTDFVEISSVLLTQYLYTHPGRVGSQQMLRTPMPPSPRQLPLA